MGCHQTIGMNTGLEACNAFLKQQEKARLVCGIEEDVLAAIAAQNNVMNGAGIMKSWFAWHEMWLAQNLRLSNLTL